MTLTLTPTDPEAPEALACLAAYAALLQTRIPGVSAAHVPHPDPQAADFRPPNGLFLIARLGPTAVGCVSLRRFDPGSGEVKRLWVDAAARGQGIARALMAALESEARRLGMSHLVLDTNAALPEAVALYRATGWQQIPPYTGPPADCWFGKDI